MRTRTSHARQFLAGSIVLGAAILSGCGKSSPTGGGDGGAGASGVGGGVPSSWTLREPSAKATPGKPFLEIRPFLGGDMKVCSHGSASGKDELYDKLSRQHLRSGPTVVSFNAWEDEDERAYTLSVESPVVTPGTTVLDTFKRFGRMIEVQAHPLLEVVEGTRREVTHQSFPAQEMVLSGPDAKAPLSVAVRLVCITEAKLMCVVQVSTRKPGPPLRLDDPRVAAFLGRTEFAWKTAKP